MFKVPGENRPSGDQQVRIRLQVAETQCQGTFRLSTSIREVLLYCESKSGVSIFGRSEETEFQKGDTLVKSTVTYRPIVQSFSKLVTDVEFDKPLYTLVEKDSALRVKFEKVVDSSEVSEKSNVPRPAPHDTAAPVTASLETAVPEAAPETAPESNSSPLSNTHVYKPNRLSHSFSDETNYEMTLDQARKYQKMLSARAGDQPMLTKRLRQLQEKPKPSFETYTIRVKFPDQSNLQMSVNPDSTVQDFVSVLTSNYLDNIHDFHLYFPRPYTLLNTQENSAKPIKQVFVEQRQLLVFEPKAALSNKRYLKREVLETAEALTRMDEVKLDSIRGELREEPSQDQVREKKEKKLARLLGLNRK